MNNSSKELEALLKGEENKIANMANFAAFYMDRFQPHWVGFYLVEAEELVLGPFQGPVACTRIAYAKGVCGSSWKDKKTLIVDNVHEYPGHIACSPLSNSEIVVPCFSGEEVYAVLDIDSVEFGKFTQLDQKYLESWVRWI